MDWDTLYGLASVPVVTGLVELAKRLRLPADWAPIVAIAAGVAWNVALVPLVQGSYYPAALLGVLAGLSSIGLFEIVKQGGQALGK